MIAALIYPHQLYAEHPALRGVKSIYLVEDPLFFTQYAFHRQKLILHRATMQRYAAKLQAQGDRVHTVECGQLTDSSAVAERLQRDGVTVVQYVDPCDDWLRRRLGAGLAAAKIQATVLDDPHFLTPISEIEAFTRGRKKLFFTEFYIQQRQRFNVLVENQKPVGGQWSFDPENRKKYPKGLEPPRLPQLKEHPAVAEARRYVLQHCPQAIGDDAKFVYPTSHEEAQVWLAEFITERFQQFGDYEDAICREHAVLHHSVLTPMLNTGLLSPAEVVQAALQAADQVPINSLEGFVRQVIGWREFVRLVYLTRGTRQRTHNFFGFTRAMPAAFYDGTTGLAPVDHVIRQVLRTGYCHHIERLMILGNIMLLCEIHPDAVYQWFMELFIDAYDWVMVPNVYGMSQYADGGGMTTKPYLSGSAYILKMSDFPRGDWCPIWDALYWRFIDQHQSVFAKNPRMSMMVKMKEKLGAKMKEHHRIAKEFLNQLA